MAYATLQDLISAFGERKLVQLTDRAEPPADLVDAQVAAEALGYADNLIDGYLAARYVLRLVEAQQPTPEPEPPEPVHGQKPEGW